MEGTDPKSFGETPHVVGVTPVSQQDVDGASSMCPAPSCFPGTAAAHPVMIRAGVSSSSRDVVPN